MLHVEKVEKSFGGIKALDRCTIRVRQGQIVGLIGPNGAGKSTLFDVITGFQRPDRGAVYYKEREIHRLPTHEIAGQGLVRTFQIPRPLSAMTVLENLLLAAPGQSGESLFAAVLRTKRMMEEEDENRERALSILAFLGLSDLAEEHAGNLSTGQMKLLELGRVLMLEPETLLLDEPFAGVNPVLAEELLKHIRTLQERGMTLLIVEHNIEAIMRISEWIYVMENGGVIAEGTPSEIRENERVLDAYLGR
ncbi:MAG: ABC transporter ATP-binding protein [Methanobacteriota archaeon]|nr:MAG: ABC transporter ATP-binding protein [Euryarchaeota archaeon]